MLLITHVVRMRACRLVTSLVQECTPMYSREGLPSYVGDMNALLRLCTRCRVSRNVCMCVHMCVRVYIGTALGRCGSVGGAYYSRSVAHAHVLLRRHVYRVSQCVKSFRAAGSQNDTNDHLLRPDLLKRRGSLSGLRAADDDSPKDAAPFFGRLCSRVTAPPTARTSDRLY